MRKFTFLALVTLFGVFCLGLVQCLALVSDVELEDPYNILLRSGTFKPEPMNSAQLKQFSVKTFSASLSTDSKHVLVQLKEIPRASERKALHRAGLDLLTYIPNRAWFATLNKNVDLSASTFSIVRWMGCIAPESKIESHLLEGNFGSWAIHPDGSVSITVKFFKDVSLEQARRAVQALECTIEDQSEYANSLQVRIFPKSLLNLAGLDQVRWIEILPPPKQVCNDDVNDNMNGPSMRSTYGLDGTDVDVAIVDEGGIYAHDDFTGRLTDVDSAAVSGHSTHVAGTCGGDGSRSSAEGGSAFQWMGLAPNCNLYSYDWDNHIADYTNACNVYGIELANNSWSYTIDEFVYNNCSRYGDYIWSAREVDMVVNGNYAPFKIFTLVWSAGNERNDGDCGIAARGGYSCVAPPATCKNAIVVGAINSDNDGMTTFSSWGPVDDGRIRPDIVAPGEQVSDDFGVTSTEPFNHYGSRQGTSMAAPAVAGTIANLVQLYWDSSYYGDYELVAPAAFKAIMIQSAEYMSTTGPNYRYGYGKANAKSAADYVSLGNLIGMDRINATGNVNSYTIDGGISSFLKVTLVWNDEPAAEGAAVALVNNLDLRLRSPGGVNYYPFRLDPSNPADPPFTGVDNRNNVEQIYLTSPETGDWTLTVTGTSVPNPPQTYALVCNIACTADTVLRDTEYREDLKIFRAFKNDVLYKSTTGKKLAKLYYKHCPEVNRIIMSHKGFRVASVWYALNILPAINRMLDHKCDLNNAIYDNQTKTAVEGFISMIMPYASEELKKDFKDVKAWLTRIENLNQTEILENLNSL